MLKKDNDCIQYTKIENHDLFKNTNMYFIIECIAYKYGITIKVGKLLEKPKMKQTKKFIIEMCKEYFGVKISYKQISYLLRPQKNKFPYTSIIFIETIYNLLKNNKGMDKCKDKIEFRLVETTQKNLRYEGFLLKDIPERICIHADEFIGSCYDEIYRCFVHSREIYKNIFLDISMIEHCEQKFPSPKFKKNAIPKSVYNYEAKKVYIKER